MRAIERGFKPLPSSLSTRSPPQAVGVGLPAHGVNSLAPGVCQTAAGAASGELATGAG